MHKLPSIIIVDDHQIFREGLISVITVENIASVVGEASDGEELLQLLKAQKPDVVLMDIDMPKMNGIEATRKALKIYPNLKIIAYTMFGEEEYYYKMIELGVKGFILKTASISQLETAISEVMLGRTFFSRQFQDRMLGNWINESEENQLRKSLNDISQNEK